MKNLLAWRWEAIGMLVIIITGSLLHFVFAWLGNWPPAALVAAVNESTWEHLKLAFWPALIWGLVEYPYLKNRVNNFWLAKVAGLYLMPILIVVLFYSYKFIFGGHNLAYDIGIFIVAIIAGQGLSYYLMTKPAWPRLKLVAPVLLIIIIAAFSLLTYFPIKAELWRDSVSGGYGIGVEKN